jgi:hypothetical protein
MGRLRYRRNELKEGAMRAVGRQYFYIDYKHFCDVVKWRVAEMRRLIDKDLRNVRTLLHIYRRLIKRVFRNLIRKVTSVPSAVNLIPLSMWIV